MVAFSAAASASADAAAVHPEPLVSAYIIVFLKKFKELYNTIFVIYTFFSCEFLNCI